VRTPRHPTHGIKVGGFVEMRVGRTKLWREMEGVLVARKAKLASKSLTWLMVVLVAMKEVTASEVGRLSTLAS
jgi:hypothetical protein